MILYYSVTSVVSGITFGEEYDASHPGVKTMVDLSDVVRNSNVMAFILVFDQYPILRHLPFGPYKKFEQMVKMAHEPSRAILSELKTKFDPEKPVKNLTQGISTKLMVAMIKNVSLYRYLRLIPLNCIHLYPTLSNLIKPPPILSLTFTSLQPYHQITY